ncbi:MAG: hypothetical protein ACI4SH_03960, partial [Candidatus Scatosoma sp.]
MKTILTIMKKEFARVFKDKRLLASLILPGVLIYIIYSLMGTLIVNVSSPDETYTYKVAVANMPSTFSESFGSVSNISVRTLDDGENAVNEAKAQINESTLDLLIVFPESFDENDVSSAPQQITAYYSAAKQNSSSAFYLVSALLSQKQQISSNFTVVPTDVA